jgi:SAM-dependent methyltransferase
MLWSRLFGRPCPERRGRLAWTGTGRLLDFGCGGGSYLRRMAELGWRVAGVDVSPVVARSVRDELGIDIHLGSLPHPDLAPGSFDVITMWQSLEHVHEPLAVLRAAYELLSPGGRIVVAVPNYESHAAKWFGEYWFGLDLPRHLTHFTRGTLVPVLRAAGFRVESVRGLVHYHWLQASALRAIQARAAGPALRLLANKRLARIAAWANYALGQPDSIVAVAERPA